MMLGIVILPTGLATLPQNAVPFCVRIAVVAIRTLNGHAQGGDSDRHHENHEECDGYYQQFLASIIHLIARRSI